MERYSSGFLRRQHKFDEMSQLIWRLLSKFQINWEILVASLEKLNFSSFKQQKYSQLRYSLGNIFKFVGRQFFNADKALHAFVQTFGCFFTKTKKDCSKCLARLFDRVACNKRNWCSMYFPFLVCMKWTCRIQNHPLTFSDCLCMKCRCFFL